MAIKVTCPTCGMHLTAPDSMAGRSAKCKNCKNKVWIPVSRVDVTVPTEGQLETPSTETPASPFLLPVASWIVSDEGRQFGPFTETEIRDRSVQGEFTGTALVKETNSVNAHGLPDWRPLWDVFGPVLSTKSDSRSSTPRDSESEKRALLRLMQLHADFVAARRKSKYTTTTRLIRNLAIGLVPCALTLALGIALQAGFYDNISIPVIVMGIGGCGLAPVIAFYRRNRWRKVVPGDIAHAHASLLSGAIDVHQKQTAWTASIGGMAALMNPQRVEEELVILGLPAANSPLLGTGLGGPFSQPASVKNRPHASMARRYIMGIAALVVLGGSGVGLTMWWLEERGKREYSDRVQRELREKEKERDREKLAEAAKRNAKRPCPVCHGAGKEMVECPTCSGKGELKCDWTGIEKTLIGQKLKLACVGGRVLSMSIAGRPDNGVCPECNGRGFNQCGNCKGRRDVARQCAKCGGAGEI